MLEQAAHPRTRRPAAVAAPLAVGAAAVLATGALALADPTDTGTPLCPSRAALGIDCPLCGGLRCVAALARGDLGRALDHNLLAPALLVVLVVGWVDWLRRARGSRPLVSWSSWPVPLVVAVAGVVVAYTVARNVGDTGWLGWLAADRS